MLQVVRCGSQPAQAEFGAVALEIKRGQAETKRRTLQLETFREGKIKIQNLPLTAPFSVRMTIKRTQNSHELPESVRRSTVDPDQECGPAMLAGEQNKHLLGIVVKTVGFNIKFILQGAGEQPGRLRPPGVLSARLQLPGNGFTWILPGSFRGRLPAYFGKRLEILLENQMMGRLNDDFPLLGDVQQKVIPAYGCCTGQVANRGESYR